jgi:hypothetical protein
MSKTTTYPVGEESSLPWYFAEFDDLPDTLGGKEYCVYEKIVGQSIPKRLINGYCEFEENVADVKLIVDALNEKRLLGELDDLRSKCSKVPWKQMNHAKHVMDVYYPTTESFIAGSSKSWWTDTDHSD